MFVQKLQWLWLCLVGTVLVPYDFCAFYDDIIKHVTLDPPIHEARFTSFAADRAGFLHSLLPHTGTFCAVTQPQILLWSFGSMALANNFFVQFCL
jgi:hypothetical protein